MSEERKSLTKDACASHTEIADIIASVREGGVQGREHVSMKRKLVVVMVGLPARGKSFLATKLAYYLNWIMLPTKIFNLGTYRRKLLGPDSPAQFFSPDNTEGVKQRKELARRAMLDIVKYFGNGGSIAILDATNTTRSRRFYIRDFLACYNIRAMFVETVCNDEYQIQNNILEVKVKIADYAEKDSVSAAVADFKERIEFYRSSYQPMDVEQDSCLSFIKTVDVGRYFVLNNIQDYLHMRISRFLLSVHIQPRHIYISRHGESVCNTEGKIGGDSPLSANGRMYAQKLHAFIKRENVPTLRVWTSTLQRTIETAQLFDDIESWKALDELDAGMCDELTYPQIEEQFPDVYEDRKNDKYWTRYPRGESYADVVQRLEPRILDLERMKDNVLVVCHQAVARCLLSYFQSKSNLAEELPYMPVDLHTVYKITPFPYGNLIEVFPLGVDAVDTYVPKTMSSAEASSPSRRVRAGDDTGRPARVIVTSGVEASQHLSHQVSGALLDESSLAPDPASRDACETCTESGDSDPLGDVQQAPRAPEGSKNASKVLQDKKSDASVALSTASSTSNSDAPHTSRLGRVGTAERQGLHDDELEDKGVKRSQRHSAPLIGGGKKLSFAENLAFEEGNEGSIGEGAHSNRPAIGQATPPKQHTPVAHTVVTVNAAMTPAVLTSMQDGVSPQSASPSSGTGRSSVTSTSTAVAHPMPMTASIASTAVMAGEVEVNISQEDDYGQVVYHPTPSQEPLAECSEVEAAPEDDAESSAKEYGVTTYHPSEADEQRDPGEGLYDKDATEDLEEPNKVYGEEVYHPTDAEEEDPGETEYDVDATEDLEEPATLYGSTVFHPTTEAEKKDHGEGFYDVTEAEKVTFHIPQQEQQPSDGGSNNVTDSSA